MTAKRFQALGVSEHLFADLPRTQRRDGRFMIAMMASVAELEAGAGSIE